MLFISVEDFLTQVSAIPRLSRDEERSLAAKKAAGDSAAKEAIVEGYLYQVAAYLRRAPQQIRTLHTLYACVAALEKAVDRFDFLQDSETFTHHLSWALRQCITRCIAER